uniref:Uncharacterized protein n=1 Tax=Romanomermis culicivorax TaxID=13658 RepID=A0A915HIL3_ROMCU
AAHAGISLSEAEASIASPFTSKKADVACVPTLVAEGRCALVTSFGIFKYMVCYSLTQFLSVSLLYWIGTTLDDFQFLYIDLFLTTNLMVFFGFTAPCPRLSARSPPTRLLCYQSFFSIGLQMGLVFVVQIFVYNLVPLQPWFVPFVDPGDEKNNASYQGTALFIVSLYQYMSLMLVYSKSHPYRRTVLSNFLLTGSFLICILVSIWLSVDPPDVFQSLMSMQLSPLFKFRWFLVLLGIFDLLIALFLEDVFLDGFYDRSYRRDQKRKFDEQNLTSENYRTRPKYSQLSLSSGKHPSTFFQ